MSAPSGTTRNLPTVSILSAPRITAPRPKRPPVPAAQRKASRQAAAERSADIDATLEEWYQEVDAKAEQLASRFNMKAPWFIEQLYYGGQRQIHKRAGNAYNAFYHQKQQELEEQGIRHPGGIVKLHELYDEEYKATPQEKLDELIAAHKEAKELHAATRIQGNPAKMQDLLATCNTMIDLFKGLRRRVGVEGFFVVVSSRVEFPFQPQWYFTVDALRDYLPVAIRAWDHSTLGFKLQAFASAGCDVANLTRTSQEKSKFLKADIVWLVNVALIDITGNADANMKYVDYECGIVQRYGVVLEGWPVEPFQQPSRMGNAIGQLECVRDALKTGKCYFRKIDKKVANGEVVKRMRKTRSDKGIAKGPRVPTGDSEDEEDDDDEEDNVDDNSGAPSDDTHPQVPDGTSGAASSGAETGANSASSVDPSTSSSQASNKRKRMKRPGGKASKARRTRKKAAVDGSVDPPAAEGTTAST
ncbi:hypothetical protein FISHEDRAFT_79116 [Fistulina hepatica ATCC 64428]|uniref:Uncharacterized protein n=1 Tax=Fistulina hepatica ATCC 64428 TaxID=1128425 RepID=A0A0D6ZYC2_9AGAR|nr:hypothetical protein FISHEDRAFT_79116 [Fistulina hepatica ATCC 64428]